jgi:hypothetical protein
MTFTERLVAGRILLISPEQLPIRAANFRSSPMGLQAVAVTVAAVGG